MNRTVSRAAAVLLAVAAALAAALAVGGPFALAVVAECLAALALVILLVRTPAGAQERRAPGAAARAAPVTRSRLGRFWPGHRPPAAVRTADFPAYAKISSDLGWAPVSAWHYDHGIRVLFGRLAESVLAERHRVDLARDPARARDLVGDDIWPLIDPARPPSFDSKAPGADLPTLTRIVDRLEQL
jgi:hypothetical protein